MTETRLTDDQRAAIERVEGNLAISAGAGSGKTTVLARRFAQAMDPSAAAAWAPAAVDQVLMITFTKKAASEIAERVRRVTSANVSVAAGRRVGDAWISTFHTFCGRLVRRHVLESGVEPGFVQLDEVGARAISSAAFEACSAPLYESDADVRRLIDDWGASALQQAISEVHEKVRSMGLQPIEAIIPNDESELRPLLSRTLESGQARLTELEQAKQTPGRVTSASELSSWCRSAGACSLDDDLCARLSELGEGGMGKGSPKSEIGDAYQESRNELSAALAAAADPGLTTALQRLIRAYSREYAAIKRERNALDFDDLQERAVDLLASHPEVRELYRSRFRMIMVDEFQDTNELQMRVLNPIRNENLCIVGDERQSIYGFRYADVKVFEQLRAELGTAINLAKNFRSRPEIMHVVNGVFSMPHLFGASFMKIAAGRDHKWKLNLPDDQPRVECILVAQDECPISTARETEAEYVATRIADLLKRDGMEGQDVAILLRSGAQAPLFAAALESRGVPVLVSAGANLFDARETGELLSLLRTIAVPTDDESLLQVLGGRLVALSDDGLLAVRAATEPNCPLWSGLGCIAHDAPTPIPLSDWDRAAAGHAYHVIEAFGRDQGRYGLAELIHRVCEELDFDLTLFAQGPEGVRAWANVLKLARFADGFDASGSGDLAAFVSHLCERRDSARDSSAAADAGRDAVRIMTVHAAKGLEFPVVFVADMTGAQSRSGGSLVVGNDEVGGRMVPVVGVRAPLSFGDVRTARYLSLEPAARAAGCEEEKRCLYVAATRAEELLVMSGAANLSKPAAEQKSVIDWVRQALGDPDTSGTVAIGDATVGVTVLDPADSPRPALGAATLEAAPVFATPPHVTRTYAGEIRRPHEVSYSALHLHERCALSYHVKHSLRMGRFVDPTEQTPTGFGSAVHAVLEVAPETGPTQETILSIASRFGLDETQQERLVCAVQTFMASDVARRLHAGDRVRREEPLRVRLGGTVLVGNIDAISWTGEDVLVVDYKTGKAPDEATSERRAAYELQAACYALAAFESGAENVEVAFSFVEHSGVTVTHTFSRREDHGAIRAAIEARIDRIATGGSTHLTHYDSNVCSSCPALGGLCPIDPPPLRGGSAG